MEPVNNKKIAGDIRAKIKENFDILSGKEYSNNDIKKVYMSKEFLEKNPDLVPFLVIEKDKHFWQEDGFKRNISTFFYTLGSSSLMFGEKIFGFVCLGIGALFGVPGMVAGQSKEKKNGQKTILTLVTELIQLLIQLILNKMKGSKNA